MSDITVGLSVNVAKDKYRQNFAPGSFAIAQNTIGAHNPVVTIPTSGADVEFGDLTKPGLAFGRSLDTVNSVLWGTSTGAPGALQPLGKIKPGAPFLFQLCTGIGSTTNTRMRWQAVGAPVKVQMNILED